MQRPRGRSIRITEENHSDSEQNRFSAYRISSGLARILERRIPLSTVQSQLTETVDPTKKSEPP